MRKFTENEIPYEDFERMGFSQEMIDDLPEAIMNRLLSGEKTPLLSSSKNDSNDNPMKATIWMSREENGVVTGFYRPYDNVRDYSDFSKSQQKTLLSGGVVLTELKGQPSSFYQMDEDTNRILSCPADCLINNFNGLKNNISAYIDEKSFSEGKLQTVMSGGNMITVGIDLSDSKGYRVVEGDRQNWKQEKETGTLESICDVLGVKMDFFYGETKYAPVTKQESTEDDQMATEDLSQKVQYLQGQLTAMKEAYRFLLDSLSTNGSSNTLRQAANE